MTIDHHPIFEKFQFSIYPQCSRFHIDGLGIKTDKSFFDVSMWHQKHLSISDIPVINDHYFEWISLLKAVYESKNRFTMVEIGAGYAPWLVAAAKASLQLNKTNPLLIGVEAEPKRFAWIKKHFLDNDVYYDNRCFYNAAVVPENFNQKVWFLVGNPTQSYGASIVPDSDFGFRNFRHGYLKSISKMWARFLNYQRPENVSSIKISDILSSLDYVDFVNFDIQGAEYDVISSCINILNRKVKYIHIGTHSHDIETKLSNLFTGNKWVNIFNFQMGKNQLTPFGNIAFDDGVQTWFNPTKN